MKIKVYTGRIVFNDLQMSVADFFGYWKVGKKHRYELMQNGHVLLNGKVCKGHEQITLNDELVIVRDEEINIEPAAYPCQVVYEDEMFLIVHKDRGVIIHDDASSEALVNQVATYMMQQGIEGSVHYLHRLDKETTGLVIFNKIGFFQGYLDDAMSTKQIRRYYLAQTEGYMRKGMNHTIKAKIGMDRHVSGKMRVSDSGKEAVTHVKVMGDGVVRCELDTGRTHQIRVHLAHIGHPIVNDELYGEVKNRSGMKLWAYEVEFTHPLNGNKMTVRDTKVEKWAMKAINEL